MAIPAVTEIFKGSLDESLKKLVQPASVVPATIFTLLWLVILFPAMLRADVPLAAAFSGLDDPWKVVVLTGLTLVFGYVLLNLGTSIQRFATGELWAESPVARALQTRERARIEAIKEEAERALADDDGPRYRLRRAEEARLPAVSDAAPTRFGNAMGGASASITRRYGFDLASTWTHLHTLLVANEEKLAQSLDDELSTVQVLLNLAAVVALFAMIAAAVLVAVGDPVGAAYQFAGLPIAYGLYRAACARVGSYLDLIEASVDLHRDLVREKMGLEKPKDPSGERGMWQKVSRALLYDINPAEETNLTALTTLTIETSDNLTIEALPVRRIGPTGLPSAAPAVRVSWTEHYALIASAKTAAECCEQGVRGHAVISGGKRWTWNAEPLVTIGTATSTVARLPGGDSGDSIVVPIDLPAGSSQVIRLSRVAHGVGLAAVEAEGASSRDIRLAFAKLPKLGDDRLCFTVMNAGEIDAVTRLRLEWSWLTENDPPLILLGEVPLSSTPREGAWEFGEMIPSGSTALEIALPEPNAAPGDDESKACPTATSSDATSETDAGPNPAASQSAERVG